MINKLGVESVNVEEIYSLEDENMLKEMEPILGLIFLFKWKTKEEKRECLRIYDKELFFANQVITNACAT